MRCKECGTIISGYRVILAILDNPSFCSEKCCNKYITKHQKEVNGYISEIMTTRTKDGDKED